MTTWIKAVLVAASFTSAAWAYHPSQFEQTQLIGAREADPEDFPASVRVTLRSGGGGAGLCTGTVIGPRAMLIASHCVQGSVSAHFKVQGIDYKGSCEMSPLYRRGTDHDLALCEIENVVEGIEYESLNLDPDLLKVGEELLLSGYGCTKSQGSGRGTGGNDGIYRIGEAKIQSLPSRKYDIISKGKAALCFGDSGGPAFKVFPDNTRLVVAANSKGNIVDTSYLTDTSTQASLDFIEKFSDSRNLQICGVHADTPNCRKLSDDEEEEEEEEKPDLEYLDPACKAVVENELVQKWETCLLGEKGQVNLVACDEINDAMQLCYSKK